MTPPFKNHPDSCLKLYLDSRRLLKQYHTICSRILQMFDGKMKQANFYRVDRDLSPAACICTTLVSFQIKDRVLVPIDPVSLFFLSMSTVSVFSLYNMVGSAVERSLCFDFLSPPLHCFHTRVWLYQEISVSGTRRLKIYRCTNI